MQELVFIKYNQALKDRYDCLDKIDPVMLYNFNYHTKWLTREMGEMGEDGEPVEEFVHENDDLTWDQVANASGVNEPIVNTRASIRAE